MRSWLNYIFVHVDRARKAYTIIDFVLRLNGIHDMTRLKWNRAQFYRIGTR